ncbi:MAG: S-layer homology domain-containing protein [Parabacteroides sp.]|nr:S-layer homology domain-containing protein [Parabacteroides sp.]
MKRIKRIEFYSITILLLIFSLGSNVNAQVAENNEEQKRQTIIDSVHGFGSDTVVANDKDLIITLQDPAYMIDMITGADIGAAKGGGVGALVFSRQDSSNYDFVEVSIKEEAFKNITEGAEKSNIYQLELDCPLGLVRFIDRNDIVRLGSGNFKLKIQKSNYDILNQNAKAIINNRPFVLLNLEVSNKGLPVLNGDILLSIPYEASEENLNQLTLYKIDGSGGLTQIKNSRHKKVSRYNRDKYYIQALINEAGSYAVGYEEVAFNDVSGWYQPYVNFVSARGIMYGNDSFMPNNPITRGDLAHFLANMSDVDIKNYNSNVFLDISNNHLYAKSIAWAYSTGVIEGYEDGTFKPDQIITRQELAAMLNRYTNIISKAYLPMKFEQKDFKDDKQIASYAKESVYYLQQAGVINGRGNNYFVPLENVTRAECAKMITTVMNGIMDGKTTFVPLN